MECPSLNDELPISTSPSVSCENIDLVDVSSIICYIEMVLSVTLQLKLTAIKNIFLKKKENEKQVQ